MKRKPTLSASTPLCPCPQVLPILFATMAETDSVLREEIFTQLTRLVAVVKQHMRRFLPDLLQLIHTYWASSTRICLQVMRVKLLLPGCKFQFQGLSQGAVVAAERQPACAECTLFPFPMLPPRSCLPS